MIINTFLFIVIILNQNDIIKSKVDILVITETKIDSRQEIDRNWENILSKLLSNHTFPDEIKGTFIEINLK